MAFVDTGQIGGSSVVVKAFTCDFARSIGESRWGAPVREPVVKVELSHIRVGNAHLQLCAHTIISNLVPSSCFMPRLDMLTLVCIANITCDPSSSSMQSQERRFKVISMWIRFAASIQLVTRPSICTFLNELLKHPAATLNYWCTCTGITNACRR